jgi:hypothetical protein
MLLDHPQLPPSEQILEQIQVAVLDLRRTYFTLTAA